MIATDSFNASLSEQLMTEDFIGRVVRAGDDAKVQGLFADSESPAAPGLSAGAVVRVRQDTTDLLAVPDSAQATLFEVLERFDLDPDPPIAVLREVSDVLAEPGFDDDVEDLASIAFVTIDNDDSQDLDQALFIEKAGDGYRVWYALADASYYVRPDTKLYDRAVERGTSFYLPGMSVPMLPRALSEGIVSLNPAVDRRALVFVSTLTAIGECTGTEIKRGTIRSRAKLSYNGVQAMFDEIGEPGARLTSPHKLAVREFSESLLLLREVGNLRIELARERDVVEYNRRSPEVALSHTDPTEFELIVRERNDVEKWNEQLSLLCNIEGARLLEEFGRLSEDLQSVFRVHLPPLADRLRKLKGALDSLVDAHALGDEWRWAGRGKQSLADYLEALPVEPETERVRQAIDRLVRYSNRASEFCPEAGPHHALGVDSYARFSAPMREIVGIFTHKELLEAMGLEEPRDRDRDEQLRDAIIRSANEAKKTQKRLDKEVQLLVIDRLLRRELALPTDERPVRQGTIVGVKRDRVYVALDAFAIDLKVYAPDLEAQFGAPFEFETHAATSAGITLRVGDSATIRVGSWDAARRRFVLHLGASQ